MCVSCKSALNALREKILEGSKLSLQFPRKGSTYITAFISSNKSKTLSLFGPLGSGIALFLQGASSSIRQGKIRMEVQRSP